MTLATQNYLSAVKSLPPALDWSRVDHVELVRAGTPASVHGGYKPA